MNSMKELLEKIKTEGEQSLQSKVGEMNELKDKLNKSLAEKDEQIQRAKAEYEELVLVCFNVVHRFKERAY